MLLFVPQRLDGIGDSRFNCLTTHCQQRVGDDGSVKVKHVLPPFPPSTANKMSVF